MPKPGSQLESAAVRRLPGVALLLSAAACAIYALPEVTGWLQFDRAGIASGQWWRILTCHWTHWSADNLIWDVAGFAFLAVLCERDGRRRFVACVLASALLIPLAVWRWHPDMQLYRGLSGIDSAVFGLLVGTIACEQIAARNWRWLAAIALLCLGFVAKISYEIVTGTTFFVDSVASNFVPVPIAHAAGMAVGLCIALAINKQRSPRTLRN